MAKILFYIPLLLLIVSCGKAIEKPQNLLSEEEMAVLIAEFAIDEQGTWIVPEYNQEVSTRKILNKYKTSGDQFTQSYQYYVSKPETMKGILEEAQKIILDKDPKSKEQIEKRIKENPVMPH